jgi:hypothetical protein
MVKYRYRSVVADHSTAAFLENWYNSSIFPQGWKCLTRYTKIKYVCGQRNTNIRATLMINDGIQSKPTHLEGFRRLLTSAAEISAVGKKSVVTDCETVMVGQDVLKIDLK